MKQFGILLALAAALVVVAAIPYPMVNQEEEEVDLKDDAQLQSVLESLMTAQGLDDNMEEDEAEVENQLQQDEIDEAEAQLFRRIRKFRTKLRQWWSRARPKIQDTEVQNQEEEIDEADAQRVTKRFLRLYKLMKLRRRRDQQLRQRQLARFRTILRARNGAPRIQDAGVQTVDQNEDMDDEAEAQLLGALA